jgi:GWxTD domain-containing protein
MTNALAWTLIHFVWEGALIALALAAALGVFRHASARLRYGLACAALLAMVCAFGVTLARLRPHAIQVSTTAPTPAWSELQPASATPIPQPPSPQEDPLRWLVPVWTLGAGICCLRSVAGWIAAQRLRRAGVCAAPEDWQRRMRGLAERLRISMPVVLLESCLAEVPVVMGCVRPAILIPAGLLTGFPPEQIECFLLHELAHIRRWDYLVNLLQSVCEDLLFYHPAVWWVSSVIRAERENCCDDVVAAMGDARVFAAALAALEHNRIAGEPALAANGGRLMNRIRRLLGQRESARSMTAPALLASLLAVSIAVAIGATEKLSEPELKAQPELSLPLSANWRDALPQVLLAQAPAPVPVQRPAEPEPPSVTPYQRWLNEEVVYIISDEERRAFRALQTDEERQQFIGQFWLRRDPTPGTPANEAREEYYRRIAYANANFGDRVAPGWKTDRGMIYIKYGPPDEREEHPTGGAYERPREEGGGIISVHPFERWRYRYIEGIGDNVNFEFVDPSGTGEYHLTTDPSEKNAAPARPAPMPGGRGPAPQAAAPVAGPLLRFFAETTLVRLSVTVADQNGNNIQGLSADDFVVTEDGVSQAISVFADRHRILVSGRHHQHVGAYSAAWGASFDVLQ